MKTKVISTLYLDQGTTKVGAIPANTEIVANPSAASGWHITPLTIDGNALLKPSPIYIATRDLDGVVQPPPTEPPPPPSAQYPGFPIRSRAATHLAGVNVITQTDYVWRAAEQGCRSFLVVGTGDAMIVGDIKSRYPDATVLLRPRVATWTVNPLANGTTPQQIVDYWFYGGVEGCIHLLFNEGDQVSMKGPGFRDRLIYEVEVAKELKKRNPNLLYAAGGYSMGTPDLDNPADRAAIKEILAPAYNSGLCGYDSHNYLPDMRAVRDPSTYIHFIKRYTRLFTECGFNPAIRNVVSGEGGIDNGSNPNGLPVGGFPAQGATDEDLLDFVDRSVAAYNEPIVVNGRSYPNPMAAAVMFCACRNDEQWIPFDISDRFGVLGRKW